MTTSPQEFFLDWENRRCLVQEVGAKEARQVARRVANVIGGAIRETAKPGIGKEDVEVAIITASGAVLERLDDQTIDWLTQTFMRQTLVETDPGTEQFIPLAKVEVLVFGGGPGLARWYRWMRFCLEITCGDFFGAAFAELKQKGAAKEAPITTAPENVSPITSRRSGSFTA